VLLPVIEGLAARGVVVHVFAHADFRGDVERAGARFVDLFARYPIEAVDSTSIPVPSRLVTFAGAYAEQLAAEVAGLAPALILYDTFSVVAPVIARRLGVPYVNVCPNHAPVPARVTAALRNDPRVATSAACWAAVRHLRDVHGISDAGPFWYAEALSPYLNLYPEPAEFIDAPDRAAFEPVAFFGSLAPGLRRGPPIEVFPGAHRRLRVYAAFGTVIWWYYEAAALAALRVIAAVSAELDIELVIGLGGHRLDAAARAALERPNVRLLEYAPQWAALQETDVFVTHHGLNSTHEAVFHEVPMLSYPLFSDQPALARRCQALGLAVPLAPEPRAPIAPDVLRAAFRRLTDERPGFAARLAAARAWELRTIGERSAVVDRILALTEGLAPSMTRSASRRRRAWTD
jgi:MGT family glycosyltransferase